MITELIDMLTGTKFLDKIGNWFYSIISYRRLALNSINISNPIMEKVVILKSSGFVPNMDLSSYPQLYAILLVYQGNGDEWELIGINNKFRLLFKGVIDIESPLFNKEKNYIYLKPQK